MFDSLTVRLSVRIGLPLFVCLFAAGGIPPFASAASGGASAPERDGGAGYGSAARPAPPMVRVLRVRPGRVIAGRTAKIRLRISAPRGSRLRGVRIVLLRRKGMQAVARVLVRLKRNRTITVRVPTNAAPRSGRYIVRVHAKDQAGQVLRRTRTFPGRAELKIRRPAPKPAPKPPAPPPPPAAAPATPPTSPGPSTGGVFPVQGDYTLGGVGARFGTARAGHTHQGQDIVAAEGLPVVAPFGGTIVAATYQAGGAGYYVALDASDGRSYFFAHCRAGSTLVQRDAVVAAGTQLCAVGSTGSSTGPHLHFEIWLGGWRRDKNSVPIDPLPDLLAWRG